MVFGSLGTSALLDQQDLRVWMGDQEVFLPPALPRAWVQELSPPPDDEEPEQPPPFWDDRDDEGGELGTDPETYDGDRLAKEGVGGKVISFWQTFNGLTANAALLVFALFVVVVILGLLAFLLWQGRRR
jgi:hypothetical protein